MKRLLLLLSICTLLTLGGCAATKKAERTDPASLLHVNGTVQEISGSEITLLLKAPEWEKASASPIQDIARRVIAKSILIEGIATDMDGKPAIVREVRGNSVRVSLTEPANYPPGTPVKLKIPKKTIAIVDFEVIKGKEKEIGRVTMEELTSALIDSGQFVVVERSKLKAVMAELQLSRSGLAGETSEQAIGKLLMAELLLTGTLSEQRGEWNINLRLVNVRSGQAVAAINMRSGLFKPSELRDSGQLPGDFEEAFLDPSWLAIRVGKTTFYDASVDRTSGYEGSKRSMRIDFHLQKGVKPLMARVENRKKRDLTLYDGIEFYARATEKMRIMAMILTSQPDDPNKIDGWMGMAIVDKDWEKIRVPFDGMVIARGWIKQGAAGYGSQSGDQVLRLNRVEDIQIGVHQGHNRDNLQGTIWLDGIRFYRD
ncbi:MAG TPA: FlgO family outer membrane protein [Syntrophales bacterium]|nr:FlgO family outer membrane protein [Syntrophales bacterium]